jgi:hypothetical protein
MTVERTDLDRNPHSRQYFAMDAMSRSRVHVLALVLCFDRITPRPQLQFLLNMAFTIRTSRIVAGLSCATRASMTDG